MNQLEAAVAGRDGRPRLALSGTAEAEEGARAALLTAPGLFRLDVRLEGDTLQALVRNLSGGELEIDSGGYAGPVHVEGDPGTLVPSRHDLAFHLRDGDGDVEVRVLIAVLRDPARGHVRFTAQAISREA